MFELDQSDEDAVRIIMKSSNHTGQERIRAHCLYLRSKQYTVIDVADILDITPRTVINITSNHREGGLQKSIKDDPRPGRPIEFDDRMKSEVVALVCSEPPEGFDRWTLELLQDSVIDNNIATAISKESLRLILKEHDLKPWQYEMWCVGELDDEYIERMEDVLDLYSEPYDETKPMVCIDEKPVSLKSDTRASIPAKPGSIEKVDYEYERHGSINVFAMVEPKLGKYVNKVTDRKTGDDFAEFISDLTDYYSDAKVIRIVMDNYGTHNKDSVVERFGQKKADKIWDKLEVHYTPIHGSWLNQAEIAIGMYQRQCLGDCRISDFETLEKKTLAWNKAINQKGVLIDWKFNKTDARAKFHYR